MKLQVPPDLLIAVPNISEGRDQLLVRRIAGRSRTLLDVHSDPDHNRSVLTYGGPSEAVIEACKEMASAAAAHLDIRRHEGVHPRNGVIDVLPFIDTKPAGAAVAILTAHLSSIGVPIYRYGETRTLPETRRAIRDGTPADVGPDSKPLRSAGVTCIGVRPVLVAFNVNIDASLQDGKIVAAKVRELSGLRALAFVIGGQVQISMNLSEPDKTGPRAAFDFVSSQGHRVVDAEVVGLVPRKLLSQLAGLPLVKPGRSFEDTLRL